MKDTRRLELKDALNLTVMMFEELEHLEEEHEVVGPIRIIIHNCYIHMHELPGSFGPQPYLQEMDTVTSSGFYKLLYLK